MTPTCLSSSIVRDSVSLHRTYGMKRGFLTRYNHGVASHRVGEIAVIYRASLDSSFICS